MSERIVRHLAEIDAGKVASLQALLREARPYVAPAQIGAGDLYGPPQHVGIGTAQRELLARIDAAVEPR